MPDDTFSAAPKARDDEAKRIRGIDQSLILEGTRKRRRDTEPPSDAQDDKSVIKARRTRASSNEPVRDETPEEVQKGGMVIWNKLTTCRALDDEHRLLANDFMQLPSEEDYPDYYTTIRRPISFDEIKAKLDNLEYKSLSDVRVDFNQVFVNAKRYNAGGSSIFLDAKRLHRALKVTYASLTGESHGSDAEEPPLPAPAPAPVASNATATLAAATKSFSKRGPTLKPWLTKKLAQTLDYSDPVTGRSYSADFKSLPDRKAWAEYYRIITHPICFDNVSQKVQKRIYTSVRQFVDDVEVIFANALFFNEESSRIWKDARLMQVHFHQVMKEEPPNFVPPRKYITKKMRLQEEALALGLPDPTLASAPKSRSRRGTSQITGGSEPPEEGGGYDDSEDDEGREESLPAGGTGSGYGTPFSLPPPPQQIVSNGIASFTSINDNLNYPISNINDIPSSATSTSTAVASPFLPSLLQQQQAEPTTLPYSTINIPTLPISSVSASTTSAIRPIYPNSPGSFSQIVSDSYLASNMNQAPFTGGVVTPFANGNRVPSEASIPLYSSVVPLPAANFSRSVAKIPSRLDIPTISHFIVLVTPSTTPLTLANDTVRQHSFAIPSTSSDGIEIIPFYRHPGSESLFSPNTNTPNSTSTMTLGTRGKGKGRETSAEVPLGESAAKEEEDRITSLNVRPLGTAVTTLPALVNSGRGKSTTKYGLIPRLGLTVVEFVVKRRSSEGEEEVYRIFLNK